MYYLENPILRHWYSSEFRYKLEQKLDFEKVSNECFEFSYNLFIDIVSKWQDEGHIRRDFDKKFILAIFDSISYIDTNKKEIREHHFPMLLEFIIESIVNGLEVKEESRGN